MGGRILHLPGEPSVHVGLLLEVLAHRHADTA